MERDRTGERDPTLTGEDAVAVLSGLPEAVFVADGSGRLRWWNDALRDASGYADAELATMDVAGLVPSGQRAETAEAVDRVAETGRAETVETEVVTAAGEHAAEMELARVSLPDGPAVAGICRRVAERRRDHRLYETAIEAAPDIVYALDADHRFRTVNEAFVEAVGIPREDLLGEHISVIADAGVVDESVIDEVEAAFADLRDADDESVRLEAAVEIDGHRHHVENNFAMVPGEAGRGAIVNVARDVTDRVEHERELERRRDELATLDDVNALVQETIRALVGAADREEMEHTVCERLADSPRYRAVWTTERVAGQLEPRTVAGCEEFVAAIADMVTSDEEWTDLVDPVADASVVSVSDLQAADLPERLREVAAEYGVGAGVAVPLSYGDVVYGALVVDAAETCVFSQRERAAFETLGRAIGLAVNAVRHRQLTFSDAAVAVEFRATGDDDFFVAATRELDCRIEVEGMVPAGQDEVVVYLSIHGASPAAVVERAVANDRVVDCRTVATRDDGGTIEVVLTDSPAKRLRDTGATLREAHTEDGVAEVVAEVAPGEDVREAVEAVAGGYDGVEFVGRRDVERSVPSGPLDDRLTDRQRSALRAAYLAGYYQWPRGSTAEEVADALGVSAPTLHQHLRAAESKVMAALFGTGASDT